MSRGRLFTYLGFMRGFEKRYSTWPRFSCHQRQSKTGLNDLSHEGFRRHSHMRSGRISQEALAVLPRRIDCLMRS